ncbi:MAG: DUF3025 domain-containing protein [Rhodocyclaceae bacterium]|nr:DUF3025 domain-containing protein [Rhodocyclaceae bacterium]
MIPGGALELADRPLYRPFGDLLRLAGAGALPDCRRLNEIVATRVPGLISSAGAPLRFALPSADVALGYEQRIARTGEVATRPGDWHDFFNALVWAVYPQSKRALNVRHLREIERQEGDARRRGPVRDALTQFDECGVVVSTALPELAEALAAHEWESVFWTRRARLAGAMDFSVFGHASLDLLREPFIGLCGKALYRPVGRAWFELPTERRCEELDAWLAARIADDSRFRSPREFSALPLLGIPGVTHHSECRDYYLDTRQFRPRRRSGLSPE